MEKKKFFFMYFCKSVFWKQSIDLAIFLIDMNQQAISLLILFMICKCVPLLDFHLLILLLCINCIRKAILCVCIIYIYHINYYYYYFKGYNHQLQSAMWSGNKVCQTNSNQNANIDPYSQQMNPYYPGTCHENFFLWFKITAVYVFLFTIQNKLNESLMKF